ncbi:MAG: GAF domain-containing protein [Anaerolineales bacterium]|nr:GAF domain-containing protein [Chloroflexota bacterium]MBL6980533.1 GAF domain-containing protein [Anaerolineales bacterium]
MKTLGDISIRVKVLLPPLIMSLGLVVVVVLTLIGLYQLTSALETISTDIIDRLTIIDEIVILSEQVQSDVFHISVLKSMELPVDAIRPIESRLETRLVDLDVSYGQLLKYWNLDHLETILVGQIQAPLDQFQNQAHQAADVVVRDPALGVVLVRSTTVSFRELQTMLAELRRYEEKLIAQSKENALQETQRVTSAIAFTALAITTIAIAATVLISNTHISRPVQELTEEMTRLADGDLVGEIAHQNRADELGKMGRALAIFRENIISKDQADVELKNAYDQIVSRQAAVLNLTEDLQLEISERKLAEEIIQRQNNFLLALQKTTLELLSELDLNTLLENIVTRAAQLMDTSAGFLDLYDPDLGELLPRVGIGALLESLNHIVEPGEGIAGAVWETGQPMIIDNYDHWKGRVDKFSTQVIRSIIGVPLLLRDKVIGVLGLAYEVSSSKTFDQESIEYMTQFAQLASISIENARLYSTAKIELIERKRSEEKRERLVSELEVKNKELETFVYTVSHDLRSPLVSISGFSGILLKNYSEKLDDRGKHIIHRLQANVSHMEKLIDDLLELSRIGRVIGDIVLVELEPFIGELLKTHSGIIEESQADVIIHSPLPTVLADRTRMGQVFSNLLDNAVKYRHPDRPLRIEISCQEKQLDYEFSVSDNGVGIDPRFVEKLFLPFRKLNPQADGMGIGLALVRRIIEFHSGQAWIESKPDDGITFKFTLPKKQNSNDMKNGIGPSK